MNKIHKSLLEKKLYLPTSSVWIYAQGAGADSAEIGHFWHFLPILISLKLNSHNLAFFNDQKRTTTIES